MWLQGPGRQQWLGQEALRRTRPTAPSLGSDALTHSRASALQQAGAELAAPLGLGAEQGPGRGCLPCPHTFDPRLALASLGGAAADKATAFPGADWSLAGVLVCRQGPGLGTNTPLGSLCTPDPSSVTGRGCFEGLGLWKSTAWVRLQLCRFLAV